MERPGAQNGLRGKIGAKSAGAFLGAAVGDAMGWPFEIRSGSRPTGKGGRADLLQFRDWWKQSGGRFYAHREHILCGEYSDDTQLILCSARSLLRRSFWWTDFAFTELPFWSAYERGGGGATKRAVQSLLEGREPWLATGKSRQRYFDAGGNGVAMRILPHCIAAAGSDSFHDVARDIMANGVCTHGHPRALVGAIAYGYALWRALREERTLSYGRLIGDVTEAAAAWDEPPDISGMWPRWLASAMEASDAEYLNRWRQTNREMVALVERCGKAISEGALAIDNKVLQELGCFDRESVGSGTIAAAAAIFLASRHAASPIHGLTLAAHAVGADTDTLASMTGGLAGAIAGRDWIEPYSDQLQDAGYVQGLAVQLISDVGLNQAGRNRVTKKQINEFIHILQGTTPPAEIELPDGRAARLNGPGKIESKIRNITAWSWRIGTQDGQTLYVKKVSKSARTAKKQEEFRYTSAAPYQSNYNVKNIGFQLTVKDIKISQAFYQNVIGLVPIKETVNYVNFGGIMAIHSESRSEDDAAERKAKGDAETATAGIVVYIGVSGIRECYDKLRRHNVYIVRELNEKAGTRRLICRDPDGHLVEVYEKVEGQGRDENGSSR